MTTTFDRKRKYESLNTSGYFSVQSGQTSNQPTKTTTIDDLAEMMAKMTCESLEARFKEAIGLIQQQTEQIQFLTHEIRDLKHCVNELKDGSRYRYVAQPGEAIRDSAFDSSISSYLV